MPRATADASLAADLVAWFRANGRDYPWRRTTDPYAVLVSEVMLQQTQISTVLDRGYYSHWLTRFPDFATLAAASEAEVLKAWEGLGYYRRARNLQRLAQTVAAEHGGVFPSDPAAIRALPGIGPYTAGAVASFAFGLAEPIVDGNVARVLSRVHNDSTPVDSTAGSKRLWERAAALVRASSDPRALNSALMELGQTVCKTGKPLCDSCPVRRHCRATAPAELPVKSKSTTLTAVTERVFFQEGPEGVLLERETGSRRTGLWKLPALPAGERTPPVLLKSTYGITRYKVTLWVHEPPVIKDGWPDTHQWVPRDALNSTAMPSPYRRALESLLRQNWFELENVKVGGPMETGRVAPIE
jgi:A/G-specific adenine glycosylase